MQLQYKTLSFKAATADDQNGLGPNEFDGYASTFMGPVDSYGELIAPTAFDKSIDFFLESGVILREHSIRSAIGRPLVCRTDEKGLYLKALISETTEGRDALTLLRDKVIKKMSIGFVTEGYEILSQERGVELLGEEDYQKALKSLPWYIDNLMLLTQVKLYETSLVALPANTAADILGVKSLQGLADRLKTKADFERALTDVLGFAQDQARVLSSRGYDAPQRSTDTTGPKEDVATVASALKSMSSMFKIS